MQLPKRHSQTLRDQDTTDDVIYLTTAGKERLERELARIEAHDLPETLETMRYALSLGDYSENAEYVEAKAKLARLHGRVLTIKDRLKRAILVSGDEDVVAIGSVVTVQVNSLERTYTIVGAHEANPSKGRISYLAPVGKALLGARVGDRVEVPREGDTPVTYLVLRIEAQD